MATPTQPVRTIETPYGTARMSDARTHDPKEGYNSDRAHFYFETLTVNNKEYSGSRFAMTHAHYHAPGEYSIHDDNYYASLTESARRKVSEALTEATKDIIPLYLDDLDDDSKRLQIKAELKSELGQGIYKAAPSRHDHSDDAKLRTELIDEIMTEFMAKRESGMTWNDIYFDRD
jgi:hypothetical protein